MFNSIDLSFYENGLLDELVSGEPKIDRTILLDLARQAQEPILELGCGYGRITIPLAQRGVQDLTGLELSAPSLAYARKRAGDLPIQWVEADVRDFHLIRSRKRRLGTSILCSGRICDFGRFKKSQILPNRSISLPKMIAHNAIRLATRPT